MPAPAARPTPPADRLARRAAAEGRPLASLLLPAPAGPVARACTLLAVCPNSEDVLHAALLAAREADAPLFYAATLNQVDLDGGYTGWTPAALAEAVARAAAAYGVPGPVLLGLDHGGPWKKDRHVLDDLSYDAALAAVKRSLEACLDAGYALLHVDPTVDRRLPDGEAVPVDAIVARTVELMAHAEAHRKARGLPPVAYEVGTEEVGGGLQRAERFIAFLDALAAALRDAGLPRPSFVVGDVGTALDSRRFDAPQARRLARHARRHGALLKGHYTDGVAAPERYPIAGMGGANVGPGLTAVEYRALADLVRLERRLGRDAGLPEALAEAVVRSGRWRKWRRPDEAGAAFDDLAPDRRRWMLETGSRYVWTDPAVRDARARLYRHVAPYRDAEAYVRWRLKEAILRYFHAFNLVGVNRELDG